MEQNIEHVAHWVEGRTDNPNVHNIICSHCIEGYQSKGHANSIYTKEKFKYCPKCGYRMIRVNENEVDMTDKAQRKEKHI